MAGSGNELTTWASSAAYHQDKGDYNDNVIVPRSILVDTADAIRIKKSGTAEVKSDVDVSGETFLTSSAITPEDFATEIANITSGNAYTTMGRDVFTISRSNFYFNWTVPDGVYSTEQILYIHMTESNTNKFYCYDKDLADYIISLNLPFVAFPLNYQNATSWYQGKDYFNTSLSSYLPYFLKETIFSSSAANDFSWKDLTPGETLTIKIGETKSYKAANNTAIPSDWSKIWYSSGSPRAIIGYIK